LFADVFVVRNIFVKIIAIILACILIAPGCNIIRQTKVTVENNGDVEVVLQKVRIGQKEFRGIILRPGESATFTERVEREGVAQMVVLTSRGPAIYDIKYITPPIQAKCRVKIEYPTAQRYCES
jgi:hypothetical protein